MAQIISIYGLVASVIIIPAPCVRRWPCIQVSFNWVPAWRSVLSVAWRPGLPSALSGTQEVSQTFLRRVQREEEQSAGVRKMLTEAQTDSSEYPTAATSYRHGLDSHFR